MLARLAIMFAFLLALTGCTTTNEGRELARQGDEIVVAGRMFHTGAPVVLWMDPGGYDAYRVERRFAAWEQAGWKETSAIKTNVPATPNRFGLRSADKGRGPGGTGEALPPDELKEVRGGGWTLDQLRQQVDQFVYHYDVCGVSRTCFDVLHDHRGLSVHFMLDVDGTIYQTLDLKERAWHATTSNDRSVGIEIANIGAYGFQEKDPFDKWYQREPAPGPPGTVGSSRMRILIPPALADSIRTPGFIPYAARSEQIIGPIQGRTLRQYDFTPQQYASLIKLTATLCQVLPKIHCDAPRDADGKVLTTKLPDDELAAYSGLLGHYHLDTVKSDPGPAFDWDKVITGAREELHQRQ